MFSRTPERKMRHVRSGLLLCWFILVLSLIWDPLTPGFTAPEDQGSPFRLLGVPVMVQGQPLSLQPYPMGSRIFWTILLPLLPLILMLFGHETWRRICPLSHVSQIPHMLGWQRKVKKLNRNTGRVERVLALLPESWLRKNHWYFQFGFLTFGLLGRILFYNSDRLALVFGFVFMMTFALIIGLMYGGKTWCNYFCPVSVIQDIYTGPGGLLDSKSHIVFATPTGRSVCRAPAQPGDKNICVGCTFNCPDVDLEGSYWKVIESNSKRFMYYGFFGLVFAFYTYYFFYSGGWDYYMTGAWTHESGQLRTLLAPGFYVGGVPVPIPKLVAAPLYFAVCILVAYGLFVFLERAYGRFEAWRGETLSKAVLRHRMLTVCAFLAFNLFYIFAGRPNILLMPAWAIKLIDASIVLLSVIWLMRSLGRDADSYRHEHLARTLRDQLVRIGFRSEETLEGRPIDRLSPDEVYVLAKTLPNFTIAQKRQVYRGILTEALATGRTKSSESLRMLSELRTQLGLTDADHDAITQALGIQDPALFDPEAARSIELRLRYDNYRNFLLDLIERGVSSGIKPADFLSSPRALEATGPVRALFSISDEDHARIAGDITRDQTRFVDSAKKLLDGLRVLEVCRFSLVFDARPEALLARYALLMREKLLIHELVNVISSIGENRVACALAQSVYCLIGKEADTAVTEAIAFAPAEIRDAFQRATSHPALVSYVDIIEASKPADETFRELTGDRDPFVAALAVSALASSDPGNIEAMTTALVSRLAAPSLLVDDVLTAVRRGCRSDTIVIMAELLAVDVFAALELGALADIARRSVHLTFYAGDQICRVGERSDSMFVLVRGKTEAWVRGDGDRMVLGRANDGAVFGELGVITGRPRSASIEVASATATVIAIPGDALDELLGRDLHAARGILTVVSGYLLDTLSTAAARRSRASGEPAQAA